jgi:hypothetical protein
MITCSDEQYLPAIDRLRLAIQAMKAKQALLQLNSMRSTPGQHMLQAPLLEVLTHADAAEAAYQQQQITAGHSHINASTALQLIIGVPATVLVLLDTMQQQALLNVLTALMSRGMLLHLTPLIGSCSTAESVMQMAAQLQSFVTVLDNGSSSGDLLLSMLVQQALSHLQWLLPCGIECAGHYVRLCYQLLTATTPADLSSQALAVYQESSQMQQQELEAAAAAAAASGAGFKQGSAAAAADASAAAPAAAFAEQMADAVLQPDTPSVYGAGSGSFFGCEPGMGYFGSFSSSTPAAADSYFGAGQYSLYCEQPDLTGGSCSFGSSKAADLGCSDQQDSSMMWEQTKLPPIFVDAAANYASPAGFDSSSSTVAAAYAGDGLQTCVEGFSMLSSNTIAASGSATSEVTPVMAPDTPVMLSGSTAIGGTASRLPSWSADSLWHQQQGSSLPEQPGSSSSSLEYVHADSSMAAASPAAVAAAFVQVSSGGGGSSSSVDFVDAGSSMAAASPAAAAAEFAEVSGGSSSSSSALAPQSGKAKVLRCLTACALVSLRIMQGCAARRGAAS